MIAANCGIDLCQSSDVQLGYIYYMKMVLVQLRLSLAVILLIAASAVAGAIGQTSATSVGAGVPAGVAMFSASTYKVMNHVAAPDRGSHHSSCDGCLDCVHSTGSSCCAVGISASDCSVLHEASVGVRFMAGKVFLATGIDPQAPLQPPQHFV